MLCRCKHDYKYHHSPGGGWAGYGDECKIPECKCADFVEDDGSRSWPTIYHPNTKGTIVGVGEAVGKEEKEAVAFLAGNGFATRIICREGNPLICTRDYRTDRINLTIENGKVKEIKIG